MALGRRWVPMTRQEWGLVTLIGVLWFGVYSVALNAGEQHVDAGTAAMLIQRRFGLTDGSSPWGAFGNRITFAGCPKWASFARIL